MTQIKLCIPICHPERSRRTQEVRQSKVNTECDFDFGYLKAIAKYFYKDKKASQLSEAFSKYN